MTQTGKIALALLFTFCLNLSGFSQVPPVAKDKGSYAKNFNEGCLNLLDYEYLEALKYFMFAYKYDSTNANIHYKIGQCYLNHPTHKHLAEKYLERAIQDVTKKYHEDEPQEKHASIMAYFFLGQAYHFDGRLDEATKMYDTYESYLDPKKKLDHEDLDLVEHYKTQVKNAHQMMMAPVNVKIVNLGDSINSVYNELSPVISADEQVIYYTLAVPDAMADVSSSGVSYREQIVTATRDEKGQWSKPSILSPFVNTGHEATVNLSPDGQTLIIFRGDVGSGDLYYTTFDGKDWIIPSKFGSNINTEYWESHAALSRDGNTLYFVSDRPGGLGGRDIYRCVKLPNGQWSLAQNVGPPINTQYDEDGPFLGADGITFYFASNGDKSMGGFDIMFSMIDENGKFSEPVNMGYPVNTTDDDLFFVVSPDNKRFYFSSGHEEIYNTGIHEKGHGENDIYMGVVDMLRENPLALFRGRFLPGPCDSLPDDIIITVTSATTGEVVGTYRPNRRSGTFSVIIPPGSKYHFSYEQGGTELMSEDVFVPNDISYEEIQKAINLKPIRVCPGMVIKEDTTKREILLNVTVLNNKREAKPIANATVTLTSAGMKDVVISTDEKGRVAAMKIETEKSYQLTATDGIKTSESDAFNTIGAKTDKTIERTLYLEKAAGTELKLNVLVLTNKSRRAAVANAKVTVKGTDGSVVEMTSDEQGRVNAIALKSNTNYEIKAEKDGKTAARATVSTHGIRKSKTFDKTLYLEGGVSEVPDNSEVSGDCFTFYFKYNMNEVDESAPEYKQFLDKIAELSKSGSKVGLRVLASASTVPSRKFSSNKELAQSRANNTADKLKNALHAKGVTDINVSTHAKVSGPAYKNDYTNTEKYGKHQYVKICIAK